MPAAVLKGIILSISLITALSIAVLENPQIQEWLEEQRRKIAELLRSLGEELDPESRRAAEAFAYEGKTPATDDGLRREASGSKEATAVATGRSLSGSGPSIRRIPVKGPNHADEAEERRRKGREYLAKRNQLMHELQQKRKAVAILEGAATPPSPTSFDALVDSEGNLKGPAVEEMEVMPSPPAIEPVPEKVGRVMREVERQLVPPFSAGESSFSVGGFQLGSQLADPFGDEYAMDRSQTPKPPVPPKVALDREQQVEPHVMPGSYSPEPIEPQHAQMEDGREELSYEEQLAIALSLSEADSSANAATVRQSQPEDDADLRAAIEASLRDMDGQQAAHAVAHAEPLTPQPSISNVQPLVDLTPPSLTLTPEQQHGRSSWEALYYSPAPFSADPFASAQPPASDTTDDELYRVTPQLTRASLATLEAYQVASTSSPAYDRVREAAETGLQPPQPAMEASFYSAPSSISPPPSTRTLDHEMPQEVADAPPELAAQEGASTPTASPHSFGFHTDTDSETFASMCAGSRAQSVARSDVSGVEVVDVIDDSDVDMLSEEGDGIVTPDSWTEVGSRDGEESEGDASERPHQTRASL
ncbi:hypothetical protein LTR36_004104 [Oleoguttula mirabilis]|uniref:Uncharacterized protein n=1 Tax=Oleoguttula mirabilis TaxID=1507867 RepID=A0AAV9JH80_9PEZI|nr:hypothetical protein LTR36_004104 [Oleoguttula mirabilis]